MFKLLSYNQLGRLFYVLFALFGIISCSIDKNNNAPNLNQKEEKKMNLETPHSLLMPIQVNNKWGFIDTNGVLTIAADYTSAYGYSEGLAGVKVDSLWGYIDKRSQWVIEPSFDNCQPFFENMAAVKAKGVWGYISNKGNQVISFQYKRVKPFSEGLAAVFNGTSWGFIDTNNTIVLDFSFDEVYMGFYQGKALVNWEGKIVAVDINGKTHAPLREPLIFGDNLAVKRGENGKKGYVDSTGKFIIKPQYSIAREFNEGMAVVGKRGELVGVINTKGETIIPPNYELIGTFKSGIAPAQDNNNYKWGYIDLQGDWVINPEYFHASDFNGDCAPACKENGNWVLIDRNGTTISESYKDIVEMKQGLSLPGTTSSLKNSEEISRNDAPISILSAESTIVNLFWAKTDQGWIIINSTGKRVINKPQPRRFSFN